MHTKFYLSGAASGAEAQRVCAFSALVESLMKIPSKACLASACPSCKKHYFFVIAVVLSVEPSLLIVGKAAIGVVLALATCLSAADCRG